MQYGSFKGRSTRPDRGRPLTHSDRLPAGAYDEPPSPSPSKRQKREHTRSTEAPDWQPQRNMRPSNMYTFSSKIIDPTGPGSPQNKTSTSPMQQRSGNAVRTPISTIHTGVKRLTVKNLKTGPGPDLNEYFKKIWAQLDKALDIIFRGEQMVFSMEELYRGVENVCKQKKAEQLSHNLQRRCIDHFVGVIRPSLLRALENADNISGLRTVVDGWSTWKTQLTTIRSIFYYLDRSFLLHSLELPCIDKLGKNLFRKYVFEDEFLKPKILGGTCDLLSRDRGADNGRPSDPDLFKHSIGMAHTLEVYTTDVEPVILSRSQSFFHDWSDENALRLSLADYVEQSENLFKSEFARCEDYSLDESTKRNLTGQLDDFLIAKQIDRLVAGEEVAGLMQRDDQTALKRLFELLQRKGLGERLRPAFEAWINKEGSSIVFDEEHESEMVVRLLLFKKKLDSVLETAFGGHQILGYGLKEAFENFINKTKKTNMTWGTDNDKPGEMIAKYVDMILKGGSKAIPQSLEEARAAKMDEDADEGGTDEEGQISKQLDHVLDLFRFIRGKAVFEAFYRKDLAKRLLMGRSASSDSEKSMLQRLKSECGAGFTHNLEEMFKDIEIAKEEIGAYKALQTDRLGKPPVELTVNVLSAANWPTYPVIQVEVPISIQKVTKDFEDYYKSKHTGRKLEWKHQLAHCQMRANFPKGRKEIVFSSFQAIVMLYFNEKADGEHVTYTELRDATKLTDEELKRTLQSLACAKHKVLSKHPKGRDVNVTDTFTVNLGFEDEKIKIKINQIQLKETKQENKETHERVAKDRQFETQAAIVRIMKGKKKLKVALLTAEVIAAMRTRGVIHADDIKKEMDKLVDKDYIERLDGGYIGYVA